MLTSKQLELLRYVDSATKAAGGVSPSTEEMAEAMGLQSKSGIIRLLDALEERGFIRRIRNRARGVEVIRVPGPPPPMTGAPKGGPCCPTCGQRLP